MKPKIGQYYYAPRGRFFRIFQCDHVSETGYTGTPVMTENLCNTAEQARRRVYQLNGWNYKTR
ncbi:MAG: hypothetical protein HDS41_07365 [Bacteroides sp.]|nr:hypothetical protein [Bacteroides sp.]